MRVSLLSAAVGAAIVGSAGSACALDITHYAGAAKLFYGGATATNNLMIDASRAKDSSGNSLCDSATIDVWQAKNQFVILCHSTAIGADIAIAKESEGGSDRGVAPLIQVAKGQVPTLQWLDLGSMSGADATACGSATVAGSTVSGSTVLASYTNHISCVLAGHRTSTAAVKPNGGIADVDPPLLRPITFSASDVTTYIDQVPAIQVVFGVPVTLSLYKALQIAEGIQLGVGSCTNVAPIEDNPTCVPTMTKSQLAALFTQQVADWSDFTDSSGTALTSNATIAGAGLLPADNTPRICRRVETSGTEAAGEQYFTNGRCATGGPQVPGPDDGAPGGIDATTETPWTQPTIAGSTVHAAVSSGNLRACLDAVEHNGNSDGTYFSGKPLWGLGFLSTEVSISANDLGLAHNAFRFVAINGSAATLANAINGDYDFYTDDIMTHIKAGKTGAATGTALAVQQYLESHIQNPTLLQNIDVDFSQKFGQGGLLIPPGHGGAASAPVSPPAFPNGLTNVRSKMSHTGAGAIQNCGASTVADAISTLQPSDKTPLDNVQQKN